MNLAGRAGWNLSIFNRRYIFKLLFLHCHASFLGCNTVDGAEIRLNSYIIGSLSYYFTRFYTSQVVIAGFLKHQQYGSKIGSSV